MDIYFGAKSLNNYANACKAMHNTVWKWLGEKMDSLRTDGMSAKSHLLWMQEDISMSEPERHQICFSHQALFVVVV